MLNIFNINNPDHMLIKPKYFFSNDKFCQAYIRSLEAVPRHIRKMQDWEPWGHLALFKVMTFPHYIGLDLKSNDQLFKLKQNEVTLRFTAFSGLLKLHITNCCLILSMFCLNYNYSSATEKLAPDSDSDSHSFGFRYTFKFRFTFVWLSLHIRYTFK